MRFYMRVTKAAPSQPEVLGQAAVVNHPSTGKLPTTLAEAKVMALQWTCRYPFHQYELITTKFQPTWPLEEFQKVEDQYNIRKQLRDVFGCQMTGVK